MYNKNKIQPEYGKEQTKITNHTYEVLNRPMTTKCLANKQNYNQT